jgi:hypothetical protein
LTRERALAMVSLLAHGGELTSMYYTVEPGDSLWRIAQRLLHDGNRWREIARDNRLSNPDLIFVGQQLLVNTHGGAGFGPGSRDGVAPLGDPRRIALIPATSYVFVLADELDPTRTKLVRRVLVHPKMAEEASRAVGKPLKVFPNPERFGFRATAPDGALPIGRHAMGLKPSPYLSSSARPFGATRFTGTPFWIDLDKAKAAGATLHETSEILADLERIGAKAATPDDAAKVARIRGLVIADKELLLKGAVPAAAVKGPAAMALTRGLQGVQVVGFAMSAVNLASATEESISTSSSKPIAAELVRQVGGWGSAWAGMKLGAACGAMVGIETGPGAVVTAAAGSIVGGVAGYFGFDWIADHIDPN